MKFNNHGGDVELNKNISLTFTLKVGNTSPDIMSWISIYMDNPKIYFMFKNTDAVKVLKRDKKM